MTSKFNFIKGASDWVTKVNDFMNEYYGLDSGYTTNGITYFNGVTDASGGHNIRYRTYSNKSGIGFVLYGGVSIPISVVKNSSGNLIEGYLLTLPITSLPKLLTDAGGLSYIAPSTGGQVRLSLSTNTGILSASSINGDTANWVKSAKLTDKMWIDVTHTFPIYS